MSTRTDLIGTLLDGRYRISDRIARGGMSTVYRGLDTRLDRPVAIKIMEPSFAEDPEFLSRFGMEARAVARLSHPGLVSVHDQGRDGDLVFLVMELVEGGTVRGLLRQYGRLSAAQALSVLEPVLAALSTAHRAGLVHRDVKPENVLIGPDGAVKVADFGLVRAMSTTTHTSATADDVILGTVAYLSPEQVERGDADPRSDVYSAGILLYELLTGAPPYGGATALEVAYSHVENDVPAPSRTVPDVPRELDEVVRRATHREPGRRYYDAGQMLGELVDVRRRLGLRRGRVPTPAPVPGSAPDSSGRPPATDTRVLTTLTRRGPSRTPVGRSNTAATERVPQSVTATPAYRAGRRRSRFTVTVWAIVVAVLAVAIGSGAWWLGSGRFTDVPAVTNVSAEQARSALTAAGLEAVVDETYDNVAPARSVLAVVPGVGEKVERGSTVTLTVSRGRPVVPTLDAGTAATVAEQTVQDAGLQSRTVDGEYDDDVELGSLQSVSPAAGTPLDVGTEVTLALSLGPAPVDVPEVSGRSAEDAVAELEGAGLTVGSTTTEYSAEVTGGEVISTSPTGGESSQRGSPVDVVVSNSLTVPDVAGQSPDQAGDALLGAGLSPVTVGDVGGPQAKVTDTNPPAGALVDPDASEVELVVATTVTVPSLRGRTVDEARGELEGLGLGVDVNQLLPLGDSRVRGQNPRPGTEVDPGATVRINAFP